MNSTSVRRGGCFTAYRKRLQNRQNRPPQVNLPGSPLGTVKEDSKQMEVAGRLMPWDAECRFSTARCYGVLSELADPPKAEAPYRDHESHLPEIRASRLEKPASLREMGAGDLIGQFLQRDGKRQGINLAKRDEVCTRRFKCVEFWADKPLGIRKLPTRTVSTIKKSPVLSERLDLVNRERFPQEKLPGFPQADDQEHGAPCVLDLLSSGENSQSSFTQERCGGAPPCRSCGTGGRGTWAGKRSAGRSEQTAIIIGAKCPANFEAKLARSIMPGHRKAGGWINSGSSWAHNSQLPWRYPVSINWRNSPRCPRQDAE